METIRVQTSGGRCIGLSFVSDSVWEAYFVHKDISSKGCAVRSVQAQCAHI